MIQRISAAIPEWLYKKALTGFGKNKSQRLVELMTKGLMFEQQEEFKTDRIKNSRIVSGNELGPKHSADSFSNFFENIAVNTRAFADFIY